ncbi:hypothetical protein [Psychromonas sp. SR45-3]|uniref:hypothetical protein n=1 Tax=Psychromonas sp. SR45-3 TaxID=2760930 RepID=UPI0015F9CAE0|nr:hypothetical protein [Psychromonas sp. SR45-3]MBB1273447.1 hypothetical protein [Psychromonas sp. SR45-3]
MAVINKSWIVFSLLMLAVVSSFAHTIYAPNDIPLLDNRFRIDPNTEQVTIILNHPQQRQKTVLVQPDGSKLFARRHPKESVAWFHNNNKDIITIQNPMPGPWQAIAMLNGNNRIQLLNPISLKINKLPLKVYNSEYLTSHVSLIKDGQIMTNKDYLKYAKLTVSIVSDQKKVVSLYRDDGQYYDSFPFDGELTTDFFMDLDPGRYLLNIKTKNNIFIRNVNKDIVVFPQPLTYNIQQAAENASSVKLTLFADESEIVPSSIIVDAMISRVDNGQTQQSIVNFSDQKETSNTFVVDFPLTYGSHTYSGKVFATTVDGREINFKLPEKNFELIAPAPEIPEASSLLPITSAATATISGAEATGEAEQPFQYLWIIIASFALLIVIGVLAVMFLLKRKQKKLAADNGLSLDELIIDEPKQAKK